MSVLYGMGIFAVGMIVGVKFFLAIAESKTDKSDTIHVSSADSGSGYRIMREERYRMMETVCDDSLAFVTSEAREDLAKKLATSLSIYSETK